MRKKRFALFCLALLCAIFLWKLMPHSFSHVTGHYHDSLIQTFGDRPSHVAYFAASDDRGSHPMALKDVTDTFSQHTFRLDPRSLFPSLYQPKKPVDVCISYFTGHGCGGFLLWDGQQLWVALTKNLYSAYSPSDPALFQAQMEDLVETYSE